jgi:hypothetical protein
MAMPIEERGVFAQHGKAIPEAACLCRLHESRAGEKSSRYCTKNKPHPITSIWWQTISKHQAWGKRIHMNLFKERCYEKSTTSFEFEATTAGNSDTDQTRVILLTSTKIFQVMKASESSARTVRPSIEQRR